MLNASHILETALLLLVAFLVGAVTGTVLRLLVLRFAMRQPAAVASPGLAAELPAAVAMVTAPAIAPLPASAMPVAPEIVPTPDFAETMRMLAGRQDDSPPAEVDVVAAEMRPARRAGETTSGRQVPSPKVEAAEQRAMAAEAVVPQATSEAPEQQYLAEVVPFPAAAMAETVEMPGPVTPELDLLAELQALLPETVGINPVPAAAEELEPAVPEYVPAAGPQAAPTEAVEEQANISRPAAAMAGEIEPMAAQLATSAPVEAVVDDDGAAPAPPAPEPVATPDSEPALEDVLEVSADVPAPDAPLAGLVNTAVEPATADPVAPVSEAVPVVAAGAPAMRRPDLDGEEAAAMRAIEGNWSPQRKKRPDKRTSIEPDAGTAIEAAGSAVAAVAKATEAMVAELQREAANNLPKPAGLGAPRHGMRDDLTHVIGVLPIIETALNKLGIYHFDQVVEWSEGNIAWIEAHLGIQGRIGREHWQQQARELVAVAAGTKSAKQR